MGSTVDLSDAVVTLIGMAVAILASGFFSGSEAALFSLSRLDLRDLRGTGSRRSRLVVKLRSNSRRLLVTILLGNMIINVAYFSMAADLSLRLAAADRTELGVTLSVGAVVALILVGELLPKTLALKHPAAYARTVAGPLLVLQRVILPVRVALEAVARVTTHLLSGSRRAEAFLTPEELTWLVEKGAREGGLLGSETRMMRDVIEMGEIRVREVMTPRVEVPTFDLSGSREDLVAQLGATPVARVMIIRGDRDEVAGCVDARDLLFRPEAAIEELVRPLRIVPESKLIDGLLSEMRAEGFAVALVVDEYGGTEGLVTLEDLVEEIVGELADELEDEGLSVRRHDDGGSWRVRGTVAMRDLVDLLGERPEEEEVDTVGGLVAAQLGRVPRLGDVVVSGGQRLTVEEIHRRGVRWLKVEPDDPAGGGA